MMNAHIIERKLSDKSIVYDVWFDSEDGQRVIVSCPDSTTAQALQYCLCACLDSMIIKAGKPPCACK